MSELIEREPLLENWKLLRRTRAATATPEAMSMMLRNLIKDAPAVDAVPVVHGRWVKVSGYVTPGGDPAWKCSECGKGVHVYGIEHGTYGADIADGQWISCPNCGAKMDRETTSSVF